MIHSTQHGPAFVSARLAPEDSGTDFYVTLHDVDGRPLGEVSWEVALRPGDGPEVNLRTRALSEAAAALGVEVVGAWEVIDFPDGPRWAADIRSCPCLVPHDGACPLVAPDFDRAAAWPAPSTRATGRPPLGSRSEVVRGTVVQPGDGRRVPAASRGGRVYIVDAGGRCPACGSPGCWGVVPTVAVSATFAADGGEVR